MVAPGAELEGGGKVAEAGGVGVVDGQAVNGLDGRRRVKGPLPLRRRRGLPHR